MRVLDVIQGNVTVRAAEDRDRFRSAFNTVRDENRPRNDQDTLSLNSVMESDLVRIQELQKNYVKNETSLRGLEEMQRRISGFESEPAEQRDYRGLGDQLQAVVQATRFEGESVISYLSTKVTDDKSLYMLKMNLTSEIENVQSAITDERKQIASYIVRQENLEAATGYSPDENAQKIVSQLTRENAGQLFRGMSNVQNLLSLEG
jgi:hypothetical protein